MYVFEHLKPEYSHLWSTCTINPGKKRLFEQAAEKIKGGVSVYKSLEQKTGVPWYLIGMLHYRESDCDFHTHLHNGDSLRYRTHHVPSGRPPVGDPPFTFEYSAVDALKYEGFTSITDWCVERVLYCLEQYNGWGYRQRGYPSAYVWAGTNHYRSGKFVADGVFSPNVVDSQLGCAGILRVLLDDHAVVDTSVLNETYKANVDPASVAGQSRKWSLTSIMHGIFGTGVATTCAAEGLDVGHIQAAHTWLDTAKSFMHDYGLLVFMGVCAFGVLAAYLLRKYMVEDATSGRYVPSGVTNAAQPA